MTFQYHPEWHHILYNGKMWAIDNKNNTYKCRMGLSGDMQYEKIEIDKIPKDVHPHLFPQKIPVNVGNKK